MNENYNKSISSLLTLSIDKVVSNLSYYVNNQFDIIIKTLPSHIKNKILNKFTTSSYFWKNLNTNYVLSLLIDSFTNRIDLTSFTVDDNMLGVLKNCKNLRKLYILRVGKHQISNEGLLNLFPQTPNINLLTLTNCSAVTDDVIEQLVTYCPHLSGLDIGGCTTITDKSLKSLAKLDNLLWLTLSKTCITNNGIQVLLKGKSGCKLKELRIADCLNVTDKILIDIASCCPSLEVLIFYNKYNKTDDQTCCQFEEMKYLKQLTWTIPW